MKSKEHELDKYDQLQGTCLQPPAAVVDIRKLQSLGDGRKFYCLTPSRSTRCCCSCLVLPQPPACHRGKRTSLLTSCTQQLPPASPRTSLSSGQALFLETSAGTKFPQTNFSLHLKFPVSHLTAPLPPGLLIGLNFGARQEAAEPRERCPCRMQLCVGAFSRVASAGGAGQPQLKVDSCFRKKEDLKFSLLLWLSVTHQSLARKFRFPQASPRQWVVLSKDQEWISFIVMEKKESPY